MNDDDLIRRGDAKMVANDELVRYGFGGIDGGRCDQMKAAIAAIPAAPTFTAADLERAWRLGRDAGAAVCDRLRASYARSASTYADDHPENRKIRWGGAVAAVAAEDIRALTPPADLTQRVKE